MNNKLRHGDNGFGRVLKWVPLLVLLVAGSVAWGQQVATTDAQEKRLTTVEDDVKLLLQRTTRIDERTVAIVKSQDDAKDDRNEILRLLRSK